MTGLGLRGRLTVLYGTLFLVAGAAILGLLYLVVQDRLEAELGSEAADDRLALVRQEAAASGRDTVTLPDGSAVPVEEIAAQIQQGREDIKDAALDSLLVQGSLVVLAVGLAAGATGWVVAGRGLRPLHAITRTAERIANARGPERDLSERLALTGPRDDIRRLADSFDAMLTSLDAAFDAQRRFVANASHELRTPLALERTLIELEITKPAVPGETAHLGRTLLELNEKSSALVDRLLVLADSANPVEHPVRVDLADLAGAAVAAVTGAQQHGIEIRTDLRPAPATGDPVLLEQLVRNLVENALVHNVDGGWAAVSTDTEGDATVVCVSNTGPRVLPHEVDGLFEPFRRHRADRTQSVQAGVARTGFGLGLAIVKAVTDAHHGTLRAVARPEGGLEVRATLPGPADAGVA
ncbi:sensor histidine kinase [Promicromonospora sp. NPDC052451]|uniref:sensor histidine kinase n=1 Tax=Promicromonospora sp. NPDC052451 TaxID=3364407 RepID=UPI0037C555A0